MYEMRLFLSRKSTGVLLGVVAALAIYSFTHTWMVNAFCSTAMETFRLLTGRSISSLPFSEFEQIQWHHDAAYPHQIRASMLRDLVSSKLHKGMPKREVIPLIGTPDMDYQITENKSETKYYITSGLSLYIYYDSESKLTTADIDFD